MRLPVDVLVYVMHYCRGHLATFQPDLTMSETFELMIEAFLHQYLPAAEAAAKAHPVCERDNFRCQVPGCSRSANNEEHHIRFRSQGGSDETWNLVTICSMHHRRGIHDGYVLLTGQAPHNLVWKLGLNPDGTACETYVGTHRVA
jgi:hypothetical protein